MAAPERNVPVVHSAERAHPGADPGHHRDVKSDFSWQGGYNGTLSIRNGGNSAVKTWTATLQSYNSITDAWNGTCKNTGGSQ